MERKLEGVYLYTYRTIKKTLKINVVNDDGYKKSIDDLFEIFYSLQENSVEIPAQMLQTKTYALEIAASLTLKKNPNLRRYVMTSIYTLLGIFIIFIGISYILGSSTNLMTPIIELEDGLISWEPIKHADYYQVIIGDETIETTGTFYEFEPYTYGENQIYVVAVSNSMFYNNSKASSRLTYFMPSTPVILETYYYPDQLISLTTDELGYAKYQATFINHGALEFRFVNVDKIDDLTVVVESSDETKTYHGMSIQSHTFTPYNLYTITIRYRKDEDIQFFIGPKYESLNNQFTIKTASYENYSFRTQMESDTYITLKTYNPNIFINSIMYNVNSSTASQGKFSWMSDAIEVFNNQSLNHQLEFIKKQAQILQPGIMHNIAENSQVTIYKVHIKDLENNRLFYAEYDSRYYDIRFMDAQENQLELMTFVSGPKAYITIPLINQFLIDDIYIILIPKTGGLPEGTSLAFYNLKPETGTYWPYY